MASALKTLTDMHAAVLAIADDLPALFTLGASIQEENRELGRTHFEVQNEMDKAARAEDFDAVNVAFYLGHLEEVQRTQRLLVVQLGFVRKAIAKHSTWTPAK